MENRNIFNEVVQKKGILRETFIEPPFTFLNGFNSQWMSRKRKWISLGLGGHITREGFISLPPSLGGERYGRKQMPLVSMFDPALCEILYKWYLPENGTILDPFAGGEVRGVVAHYLGYNYTGIDIREAQILHNYEKAKKIIPQNMPNWLTGDSNKVLRTLIKGNTQFDLVFSCPPYADMEVYSDLPGDISNKDYSNFVLMYSRIINKSIKCLKPGGFAIFVVSDIRDKHGFYYDFISHTKAAFLEAGVKLYNEAIYVQPIGTALLRVNRQFGKTKKLVKIHEHILIFKKI